MGEGRRSKLWFSTSFVIILRAAEDNTETFGTDILCRLKIEATVIAEITAMRDREQRAWVDEEQRMEEEAAFDPAQQPPSAGPSTSTVPLAEHPGAGPSAPVSPGFPAEFMSTIMALREDISSLRVDMTGRFDSLDGWMQRMEDWIWMMSQSGRDGSSGGPAGGPPT